MQALRTTYKTLALGLSDNATIFGVISVIFLRPLPVQNAERLVVILQQYPNRDLRSGMAWNDYRDDQAQVSEFTDVLALSFRPASVRFQSRAADRAWIEAVSGNLFFDARRQPVDWPVLFTRRS